MELVDRLRPKGYNTKVWAYFYAEAEKRKQWALDTLKDAEWLRYASTSSIEHLGACLHLRADQIAKDSYDYLQMRSHGQTLLGALDPSARDKWESITGRKISPKKMWRYNHITHTTSATLKNGKWVDFRGQELKVVV